MATDNKTSKGKKTSAKNFKRQNREAHEPLTQYLSEISKIKPLTKEEEGALANKISQGDLKSLQELVQRNLKYVVTVANKYKGCGLSLQDLIEEGNIGMIQAAKRFDASKNVKFITYAVWWIRQAIMHSLAEQSGTVKLPIKQVGKVYKIQERMSAMTQDLKREPTQSEMADSMGFREEEITAIMRAYRTHVSLDTPLKREEGAPYLDLLENEDPIPYDDQIMRAALRAKVDELLRDLAPREEKILRMRFGFDGDSQTLEEIGKKIGLSRERVRQIEKRAKSRLKSKTHTNGLDEHIN